MRHGLALRSSRRLLRTSRQRSTAAAASPISSSYAGFQDRPASCRRIHIQPHPLPAVAYCDAYDFGDDVGDYDQPNDEVHHASRLDVLASAAGGANGGGDGGGSITGTGGGGGGPRFVGSGGGGGTGSGNGPYRCPKCGANVTFQDTSASAANGSGLQSNCFYCAACSGWFLIQPNDNADEDSSAHSKFLLSKMAESGGGDSREGVPTTPSNRQTINPQFVMQHVSCKS